MAGPSGATTPIKETSKSHTPDMGSGLRQTGGCNVIQLTLNHSKNDHTGKTCTSEDELSEVETRIRPSTEKSRPKDTNHDALSNIKEELERRLRSLVEGDKVGQKQ